MGLLGAGHALAEWLPRQPGFQHAWVNMHWSPLEHLLALNFLQISFPPAVWVAQLLDRADPPVLGGVGQVWTGYLISKRDVDYVSCTRVGGPPSMHPRSLCDLWQLCGERACRIGGTLQLGMR